MKLGELFGKINSLNVSNSNIACLMNVLKELSRRESVTSDNYVVSSYTFHYPETLFEEDHDVIVQWLKEQGFEVEEWTEKVEKRIFNHIRIKYHIDQEQINVFI